MISPSKLKSVDFYRKIPRDLTEASLSGAGLSIIAALSMMLLFGMELNNYLKTYTTTSIVVDRSSDEDLLRMDFNISFPALSCEFASVDVSDVLGTNRLNITKTVRKFSIDHNLRPIGAECLPEPLSQYINHGDEVDESVEGSVLLKGDNFDSVALKFPVLVVNFFAPWCYWSNRLKPSWEKAAKIMRERYDPDLYAVVLLGHVDCTIETELCKRHHIQGYPSIRIFRKGNNLREDNGQHDHESYYGDRNTDSLVQAMEGLIATIPLDSQRQTSDDKSSHTTKRPAPLSGGCRFEGYVLVKQVPGFLIFSAHSGSHSFDTSQMNLSHIISHISFGRKISPKALSDVKQVVPYLGRSRYKLNGQAFINQHNVGGNVTIEHYLQIVKTEVVTRRYSGEHTLLEEYEFTAHSSLAETMYIPVTKFHLQPSPMQVLITENSKSFSHFITNVCAIVGGVFTVAGIVDSILHNTFVMMRKIELGKFFDFDTKV